MQDCKRCLDSGTAVLPVSRTSCGMSALSNSPLGRALGQGFPNINFTASSGSTSAHSQSVRGAISPRRGERPTTVHGAEFSESQGLPSPTSSRASAMAECWHSRCPSKATESLPQVAVGLHPPPQPAGTAAMPSLERKRRCSNKERAVGSSWTDDDDHMLAEAHCASGECARAQTVQSSHMQHKDYDSRVFYLVRASTSTVKTAQTSRQHQFQQGCHGTEHLPRITAHSDE